MRFFPERALEQRPLCSEGRNCWRHLPANRVAFLIDGAAYFDAFVSAAESACHSIIIVGWDLNSRVRLVHDERPRDVPSEFKGLLNTLTARRSELNIYILTVGLRDALCVGAGTSFHCRERLAYPPPDPFCRG